MPAPAIPGLTGIEHVGLVVPDIEAATGFLTALLGAQTLYDIGPFEQPQDWMAHHLAGDSGAQIHRMRVVKVAHGPTLELIEFTPASESVAGMQAGLHIAFYVEDMEAALATLKSHHVTIQSGPVEMTEGSSAGLSWLYFRAPWGQQMELVSYPDDIAAYRNGAHEVWRPRPRSA
ncbi:MAG: VOC family protein [Hyphomicrobiaceae bacterium]